MKTWLLFVKVSLENVNPGFTEAGRMTSWFSWVYGWQGGGGALPPGDFPKSVTSL